MSKALVAASTKPIILSIFLFLKEKMCVFTFIED